MKVLVSYLTLNAITDCLHLIVREEHAWGETALAVLALREPSYVVQTPAETEEG